MSNLFLVQYKSRTIHDYMSIKNPNQFLTMLTSPAPWRSSAPPIESRTILLQGLHVRSSTSPRPRMHDGTYSTHMHHMRTAELLSFQVFQFHITFHAYIHSMHQPPPPRIVSIYLMSLGVLGLRNLPLTDPVLFLAATSIHKGWFRWLTNYYYNYNCNVNHGLLKKLKKKL